MKSSDLTKEWMDFAHMDIDAARFLTQMRPPPLEIVCFHCQQAADRIMSTVRRISPPESD